MLETGREFIELIWMMGVLAWVLVKYLASSWFGIVVLIIFALSAIHSLVSLSGTGSNTSYNNYDGDDRDDWQIGRQDSCNWRDEQSEDQKPFYSD